MGFRPGSHARGRSRSGWLCAAHFALIGTSVFGAPGDGAPPAASPGFAANPIPFLDRYCVECHDSDVTKGGLDLTALQVDFSRPETAERWTQVYDRLAAGEMPPEKKPRPDAGAAANLLEWLGGELHAVDLEQVVLRRLNRVEYQNTIRDLLQVDLDLASRLPEDQVAHGFDNIGEALAVSPELLAVCLEAADIALEAAFESGSRPEFISRTDRISNYKPMLEKRPDLYIVRENGVQMIPPALFHVAGFRAPHNGRYRARFRARAVDTAGEPIVASIYAGDVISRLKSTYLLGYYEIPERDTVIEIEHDLESGDSFEINATAECLSPGAPKSAGLLFDSIEIEGPYLESWPPPARRQLLGDLEFSTATLGDAREVIERLLPRAFRRPVDENDIEPFLRLVESQLQSGANFEDSLRAGLQAILCSPDFLFLKEKGLPGERLGDFELASRLSYFLWSSMPDGELLAQAYLERLRHPEELARQVERMLADSKAIAFTENFTGQWLKLREIDHTMPDATLFPEFDELLKVSFIDEAHAFFNELLEKNLSVLNFADSEFLVINERLADHYGIDGVQGLAMRPVALPSGSPRGGVITMGGVLKVTANGSNTSPVRRGVWMLENILGMPSPPPPAKVSAIEPDIRGAKTLREQFEKHRTLSSCRSCHAKIDPLGYALESFDAVGGWRDHYPLLAETETETGAEIPPARKNARSVTYLDGPPVETEGELWTGEHFEDIRELKDLLLTDPDRIAECIATKIFTYALGRSVGFSDRAAIRQLVDRIREEDYGLRSLVLEIVKSEPFQTH